MAVEKARPLPDIKVNGSDGPLTISQDKSANVTISLESFDFAGQQFDWWLVVSTPFGIYSYKYPSEWVPGISPGLQEPIFEFSGYSVYNSPLPAEGEYILYFGLDGMVNGSLDDPVYDSVSLTVKTNYSEDQIKSSVPYDDSPSYSESDLDTLISGFNDFAMDFYHAVKKSPSAQGKNVFFSTYSIENALALTWAGAKNDTADEMADTLHLNLSQDQLHSTLNALNIDINSRDDQLPPSGDPFQLNIVNAIWSRIGYPLLPSYLDIIARNYDAGIRPLDFINHPENSRHTINQWVEDQTNEKIKELLPPNSISPLTAVVLTNAIYFKGSWYQKFDEESTKPSDFTRLDGTKVTTDMMHQRLDTKYFQADGFDAVELPYVSPCYGEHQYPEELSMLIIIPEQGKFNRMEGLLDDNSLSSILGSLDMGEIDLTLPKFEFEFEVKCKDIMQEMGMVDAFVSNDADFSGMVDPNDARIWIDEIYHKAFVAVDEDGTEAAAATAVVMRETAIPDPVKISADKPFVFLIRDNFTDTILFMGRMLDPTL